MEVDGDDDDDDDDTFMLMVRRILEKYSG